MSLRPKSIEFKAVWPPLKNEIQNIITCKPVSRIRWSDLFHDIYALCVAIPDPLSEQLYSNTRDFLESHVKNLYKEVEKSDQLLQSYFDRWKIYSKGSEWLQELYRYLNTQFIKKHKFTEADLAYGGIPVEHVRSAMLEIGELALDVWKRLMITPLENTMVGLLLEAISEDRDGGSINQPIVFGVIQSLVEVEEYRLREPLELYETVFEKKFLEATSDHFQRDASQLSSECSCSVYMEKVLNRLQEEDLRARKFLHPSSYDKLRKLCEKDMVASHIDVMHSEAKTLILEEKKQDLANMYKLLKAIPDGIAVLVKEMENHVRTIALNSVLNLTGDNVPNQFVENMLAVYHKYSDVVRTVFESDQEFWGALDRACVSAINHKEDGKSCAKSSEWLAKYTDYLLRKSSKATETDTEEKLTYAIVIFRYIEDKDMFQKFYARNLANRLIHSASPHMDNEELMINKLKQACGYEFTSKLHRMFQDIGVSKTLTEQFLSHIASQSTVMESGFNIQVLQAGAWPLSTQSNILNFSVPVELQPAINAFEQFYNSNFNGRKLTWLFHLATAEVKLTYLPGRTYIITMQVHQAAILLHFNTNDSATVAELEAFTQMEPETLIRTVRSLVEASILTSCSGSSEVKPDSTLSLNLAFTSKRTKFKLNQVVMQKQVEKEAEHVTSTVQQDRKYYLECIIVRIMKARKVLKHNQLVQEVITQSRTRFTPEVPFIKRTIEQLIEKQFLQRAENADEYAYLA